MFPLKNSDRLLDKRHGVAAENRVHVTEVVPIAAVHRSLILNVGAMAERASDSTHYPNTDYAQTTPAAG